jgi:DNA-binding transcriptional regulator/RsmH inhibitor MraZ
MVGESWSERPALTGSHNCRLDEKGRMKLPVEVLSHLSMEADKRIFITSVVPGRASLYPMRVWQEKLRMLQSVTVNVEAAERIERYANLNGGVTEIDSLSRILVPIRLRQKFGLENESLQLIPSGERIDIYKASETDTVAASDEAELAGSITLMHGHGVRI